MVNKKPTLAELVLDPFLRSLDGRDDAQMLTRYQACGFLNKAPATLDLWRKQNIRPPQWINSARAGEKPDIGYPLGELRLWVRTKLEEARDQAKITPTVGDPPTSSSSDYQHLGPRKLSAKERAEYGLDEELLRGRRRKGVAHETFASFLSAGTPSDEWVFLSVRTDFRSGQVRRPVDLISSLDLPWDMLGDAPCERLTLADYATRMASYLAAYEAVRIAEHRVDTAGQLPPRAPGASTGRVKP